ncbi:MAG: ATP-binding protein [Thiohalocapsa sp.]|nr:ATP-binding protein [Thiohalocapsa sp.]
MLTDQQSIFLFQCARELVYNLIKHAKARTGVITLTADAEGIELSVADDGHGFDWRNQPESQPNATGGYGLYSIRQRLAFFGGWLDIEADENGSCVTVRLPVEPICRVGVSVSSLPAQPADHPGVVGE